MRLKSSTTRAAVAAVFAAALSLALCAGAWAQQTLPEITNEDCWKMFEALPDADLPAGIATPALRKEAHEAFKRSFQEAVEFFGSEEGAYENTSGYSSNPHQVFWSSVSPDAEEPDGAWDSVFLNVYPGKTKGRLFGVLETRHGSAGSVDVDTKTRCYWFDAATGGCTPAGRTIVPQYEPEMFVEDPLVTYKQSYLYYSLRDKAFNENYEEDCLRVSLENVPDAVLSYKWDGEKFVRDLGYKPEIIGYETLGWIRIGGPYPEGVPYYDAEYKRDVFGGQASLYEFCRSGEKTPRISVVMARGKVSLIYVHTGDYSNAVGAYAGMKVSDLYAKLRKAYEVEQPVVFRFDDKMAVTSGKGELVSYIVDMGEYLGNGKFAPDAKVKYIMLGNSSQYADSRRSTRPDSGRGR